MITLESINLIQKITSLIALGLLTVQIFTNTNKKLFTFLMYFFVFVQPFLIILSRFIANSDLDPFYMFTDICAICGNKSEYTINFIRIVFYSVSVAVFVPIFKNYDNWLKKYWKHSEALYYVGFYALSIYVFNSAPLIKSNLFLLYFWGCQFFVVLNLCKNFLKNSFQSS